jgi:hypothetical protein
MKKAITFSILILFTITTLIMPYSNYEDAKSLVSLYKNSLSVDEDMSLAEFLGEKLIASGIEFDEEEEEAIQNKKVPISHNIFIQIQSGVIFHKKEIPIEFVVYNLPVNYHPIRNESIPKDNYQHDIFRPPTS